MNTTRRIAIVLLNLGGPDSLAAVKPFLFNLFNDRAIINIPQPFRWTLAQLISRRRAPVAREIYAQIGGRSPLVPETEAQAKALTTALTDLGDVRVFPAMRYWHPLTEAAVDAVSAFDPDEIVLLPLYPQFSTTTTQSSIRRWETLAARRGLRAATRTVCCYPDEEGWIAAQAAGIRSALSSLNGQPTRLLFSAHGLPEKIVAAGDPYQWQVERTVEAVIRALALPDPDWPALDWQICYQSRVGPLAWIGPATDDEIRRAAQDGKAVVVVPIAFVSEHSETLVELDIEYRKLAETVGVPAYHRVPAVGCAPSFVSGLADMVRNALARPPSATDASPSCHNGGRLCPIRFAKCPARGAA